MVLDSSVGSGIDLHQIRELGQTALRLSDIACQQREVLLESIGVRRYLRQMLGREAHRPAENLSIVWQDSTEVVDGGAGEVTLVDYLASRYYEEGSLPCLVIYPDGKRLHI